MRLDLEKKKLWKLAWVIDDGEDYYYCPIQPRADAERGASTHNSQ
jgi:hypothetical protein